MSIASFLKICHEDVVPQIDAFFEEVFVMCEDREVRHNRLRLLHAVASLPYGILDFSELPGM